MMEEKPLQDFTIGFIIYVFDEMPSNSRRGVFMRASGVAPFILLASRI